MSDGQVPDRDRLTFHKVGVSSPSSRSPRTWLLVLLLLCGFGAVVYFVLHRAAQAGQGMPPFSVYSDDRNGLAQTASVLRKLGWEPVALTRPIHQTHHRGVLILVEPATDVGESALSGLLAWIAKGNTLLLVGGRRETSVHRALHVQLRLPEKNHDDDTATLVTKIELTGYTEEIDQLEIESRATVQARTTHMPLWWLGDEAGAVLLRHGHGHVIVVPDTSLLTHRGLLRRDNVMFIYNIAAHAASDGRVYFDEYHHGIRSGGGYWGYLRYHGQHWALAHLLILAGVAVWAMAVRLGPAVPTPATRRADAVDYASAVARIYQRAGTRQRLAEQMVRDFLDRVTGYLHLKRAASPAQIVAAWRQRHPDDSTPRLQELLRGAAELRETSAGFADISERVLLTWARAFDQFTADMRSLRVV